MKSERIYLDHAATTPVRTEVLQAMLPYWTDRYANPSSIHFHGQQAQDGVASARETIADLLGARTGEIIFTGCGSESDNLALRGTMFAARATGRGNHLITTSIEHKAILDTAKILRDSFGFELTVLPVDKYGQIDTGDLESAIRKDTVLISVMAASNEIGSLQPIDDIGHIAREHGILFHTDAVQAVFTRDWNLHKMPIDLLSLAPHKFYGPKGFGILYARNGTDLHPILSGGGQEDGRRAGTENVAYAVGSAEALKLAMEERKVTIEHYKDLRDRLIDGILELFPDRCLLTGHRTERLPNHASFAFRSISGNDLLMHLDSAGISASSGSACLTGDPKPSSVLAALGLDSQWTSGGLRLTVGHQNNFTDVEYVLETLPKIIENLSHLQVNFA